LSPEDPAARLFVAAVSSHVSFLFHPADLTHRSLDFISDNSIELFHYASQSLSRGASTASVSEDIVVMALKKILDRSSHPILICCNLGRHHTGWTDIPT
jgi:hypothetical protein